MKSTRSYTMQTRAESVAGTRDRIARAALRLFLNDSYDDVTLTAIAEAADVSHQTVLNHFESKEGAARAAAEIIAKETGELRTRAVPGDVEGAVRVLTRQYERFGDANVRWALSSERLGSLVPILEHARASHRTWLETVFGNMLPSEPARRRVVINALHAATDVYTWKLLRRDLGASRAETERTMIELVLGILDRDRRRER